MTAQPVNCTHVEFERHVKVMAHLLKLHVHSCGGKAHLTGADAGWTDMVLLGPGGILFAELKIPPDGLSSSQTRVMYQLEAAGMRYAVWTPADLDSGIIGAALLDLSVRGAATRKRRPS